MLNPAAAPPQDPTDSTTARRRRLSLRSWVLTWRCCARPAASVISPSNREPDSREAAARQQEGQPSRNVVPVSDSPRPLQPRRREEFDAFYTSTPVWDIGRPQPALAALADAGAFRGRVLDIGCGTGEHAILAAERGLAATGVDGSPAAIALARQKAEQRASTARFVVADATRLGDLGQEWDTVIDSGLFHVFDNDDRARFVESLSAVVPAGGRYFLLCFSDRQPGIGGPRRVSRAEIRAAFEAGWRIDSIEPARFEVTILPDGASAWLACMTRAGP